jgi:cytochrome c peroxidase
VKPRRVAAVVVLVVAGTAGIASGVVDRVRETLRLHSTPRLEVPNGWPAPRYTFEDNPVTPSGFALGRQLFYDTSLSRDGTIACGSCHQQFAAFAHADHRVSHGVGGVNGVRNAPGLFNLAWQPDFMWDGAATHLETQPILPISNPVEMGTSLETVIDKLQADPRYPPRFAQAFGDPRIDSQRTLRALAQFVGTMVSADSHYDRAIRGRETFTAEEQAGLKVFRAQCASCHAEPLFTDFSYRSNGLDAAPKDRGRAAITGHAEDEARFRVPSLRNVALTAPYMHDGRFDTLEQVLDHYQHGIATSPTLDPALIRGVALNDDERRELLAFLQTLTDTGFTEDVRFAEVDE